MYWDGASLLWSEIATQWDADFLVETLAAADVCGITVATSELQLPGLVSCSDSLGSTAASMLTTSEGATAAEVVGVTASALPSLIENASALSVESPSSVAAGGVTDSTTLADLLSHIFVAGPSVSETMGAATVESVVAKMLTGLNTWNDAYSLWGDRTHAWDIHLSSMGETVAPYDAVGDLTETTDYLTESVQFGDVVVISCGAAMAQAESLGADFNALTNVAVAQTLSEVCAPFGEFFDKSPRRRYEYDSRTDGIWRYYDRWSNDWASDR